MYITLLYIYLYPRDGIEFFFNYRGLVTTSDGKYRTHRLEMSRREQGDRRRNDRVRTCVLIAPALSVEIPLVFSHRLPKVGNFAVELGGFEVFAFSN